MAVRTIRLAVIAATGALLIAAPLQAAPAETSEAAAKTEPAGKPLALVKPKKAASQKTARTHRAQRSADARVARKSERAQKRKRATTDIAAKPEAELKPEIANAQAQWTGPIKGEAAISGKPPMEQDVEAQRETLQATTGSAQDSTETEPAAAAVEVAAAEPVVAEPQPAGQSPRILRPVSPAPVAEARQASGGAWDQSTLIGKIFIAFGGMLTLASAARMLIA
jgi:hypothetical protein